MCQTEWTGNTFIGETAAAGFKEKPKRRSGGSSLGRQRSSLTAEDGGEYGRESVILDGNNNDND